MKNGVKFLILAVVFVLTFSLSIGSAMAEQKESPFKSLIAKIFGFTTKTVHKEVKAVGKGVKKSADVVTEEVKDVGKVVTGDVSKTKDVLVKPVTGTAEMVGTTANEIVTAPIDAAKEVSEKAEEKKEQTK